MTNSTTATGEAKKHLISGEWPRAEKRSALLGLLAALTLYALIVVGVRIDGTASLVWYGLALLVLSGAAYRFRAKLKAVQDSLADNARMAGAAGVLCAVSFPLFAASPYQIHVMAMAGIFVIMALGLNITLGSAGLADFGYVAYYTIGAYTAALLNVHLGVGFWLSLLAASGMAAALGTLVALPAIRVRGHYLALVTLGFAFIVQQLVNNMTWLTGGTAGVAGIRSPTLWGHNLAEPLQFATVVLPKQANFYFIVLLFVIIALLLALNLKRSRWGRGWQAISSDETAAQCAGLNLLKYKLVAFVTAASFGGAAGGLYAYMVGYIDPTSFRFFQSVLLIAVVSIANGRISLLIAVAAAFVFLPEILRGFNEFYMLLFGLILVVLTLIRAQRLSGS